MSIPLTPVFHGDFSDVFGCFREARHLATFGYKRELVAHVIQWHEWLTANDARVQFTEEEKAAFAGFIQRIKAARPLALRPIANEIGYFWAAYYKKCGQ